MNLKKNLIVVFAVLLCFSISSAIDKYGKLEGIVSDEEGMPLPGVSVSLIGEALQGTKTAVTNERGSFRIPLLPVSRNYEATFVLPGFKKVINHHIAVELGKTTRIIVIMETTTIEEEITVTAISPVVDTKSSTSQINISKDVIETLANDRQYQTIMGMMPGAIDANNPFMFGASGSDNIYLFDGMDSTDPMTKTWSTAMNFDNFEEMQVVISGAPAEYGRGTGAVINIVTKSGSNSFHGMGRVHITKVDWNAKSIGNRYYFSDATHYLTETRPGFNIGGPVLKDRLWFFVSWERRNKWKPSAVYNDFNDWITDLTPTAGKAYYQGHYASAKLTFKLHANHTIMAQWMEDPIRIPDLRGYLGYSNFPSEIDANRFQGGWNLNSEWTSIFGANTYMTIRYSLKRNELNNEPKIIDTVYYRGGVYYGGNYDNYYTERFSDTVQVNLSHFAETGFGLHDLKIGVEMLDIRLSRYSESYPGNEYIRLDYDDAATPMYRYVYPERSQDDFTKKNYNRVWTFFIQDKWEVVPNLTLNLGLRAEMGKWKNHAKTDIIDWGFGDMLAPRIGIAYNLKGNKIHASWGRYYDIYGDWLIQQNQPDEFSYSYDFYYGEYYGLPTWTHWTTYTRGSAATSTSNPDLKPSHMDEFGVGYEHMLTNTIAVGVDYMHRAWKNRIDDFDYGYDVAPYFNPDLDGVWHFDNAEFPDWGSTYKKYDAFILTFKKNLGDDKFQFLGSYTWSKLKGSEDTDADGYWGDSEMQDYNAFGYLDNDIRHMVKFNGNYFLPLGFNVGLSLYWFSGKPYTEEADAYDWHDGLYRTYKLEPQGSSRYPATWRLDMRLEKKFTFRNRYSFSIYADIFNVFNQQIEVDRANNIGRIVLDTNTYGADYTIETPDLDYGNFTQWFPPMCFFVGVKIEF